MTNDQLESLDWPLQVSLVCGMGAAKCLLTLFLFSSNGQWPDGLHLDFLNH